MTRYVGWDVVSRCHAADVHLAGGAVICAECDTECGVRDATPEDAVVVALRRPLEVLLRVTFMDGSEAVGTIVEGEVVREGGRLTHRGVVIEDAECALHEVPRALRDAEAVEC